jgi:crotonobetainyl-CoA:carnitine CoA-transferase CaiB-like acyl-CoA transferase
MTHNFRPGVMEKIGLDYASVRALNPRLIYGVVTGYGNEGPWIEKPGQDLLAQSISGLTQLTGSADAPPTPFGISVGDIMCGTHFAQGLLAALVRRGRTGQGALVEASLLESLLDVQFEVLTTHFNDGGQPPCRAQHRNAHAYLGAPYGIYQTHDGWLALAMGELPVLAKLIGCTALTNFTDSFQQRDEIKATLAAHLKTKTTAAWLAVLEPADYWCADVFNYAKLMAHDGFKSLGMDQLVRRANGAQVRTLRCPIRIDGEKLFSEIAAPSLGNATAKIEKELLHAN